MHLIVTFIILYDPTANQNLNINCEFSRKNRTTEFWSNWFYYAEQVKILSIIPIVNSIIKTCEREIAKMNKRIEFLTIIIRHYNTARCIHL